MMGSVERPGMRGQEQGSESKTKRGKLCSNTVYNKEQAVLESRPQQQACVAELGHLRGACAGINGARCTAPCQSAERRVMRAV